MFGKLQGGASRPCLVIGPDTLHFATTPSENKQRGHPYLVAVQSSGGKALCATNPLAAPDASMYLCLQAQGHDLLEQVLYKDFPHNTNTQEKRLRQMPEQANYRLARATLKPCASDPTSVDGIHPKRMAPQSGQQRCVGWGRVCGRLAPRTYSSVGR